MSTPAPRSIREVEGITPERFATEIAPGYCPVVLRGLAHDWPAVRAGRDSTEAMARYILRFDHGGSANMLAGATEIGGRFFYRPDLRGFNFERAHVTIKLLIEALLIEARSPTPRALYAGSAPAPETLPGWIEENPLSLGTPGALPRVWIGNASRVAAHFDVSSNVAVVAAGRRRFTLFPPEQTANLYVGPLDMTMAGQPTSMVDVEAPDLVRFPRYAEAQAAMLVAELEPGDAIFIPSLWWHEVRAFGPLNVLVNYWWGQNAGTSPFPALIHALLVVRDLPQGERAAVRAWFDHWVFSDDAGAAAEHLPAHARGVLGAPSAERTQTIRDYLMRALGRE